MPVAWPAGSVHPACAEAVDDPGAADRLAGPTRSDRVDRAPADRVAGATDPGRHAAAAEHLAGPPRPDRLARALLDAGLPRPDRLAGAAAVDDPGAAEHHAGPTDRVAGAAADRVAGATDPRRHAGPTDRLAGALSTRPDRRGRRPAR